MTDTPQSPTAAPAERRQRSSTDHDRAEETDYGTDESGVYACPPVYACPDACPPSSPSASPPLASSPALPALTLTLLSGRETLLSGRESDDAPLADPLYDSEDASGTASLLPHAHGHAQARAQHSGSRALRSTSTSSSPRGDAVRSEAGGGGGGGGAGGWRWGWGRGRGASGIDDSGSGSGSGSGSVSGVSGVGVGGESGGGGGGGGGGCRYYVCQVVLLSLAFSFVESSILVVLSFESAVNGALGVYSSLALYAAFTLGAVPAPVVLAVLRPQRSMVLGLALYCLYVAANLLPSWYTLMPAGALAGVGGTFLWTAQGTYVTLCAERYAAARIRIRQSPSDSAAAAGGSRGKPHDSWRGLRHPRPIRFFLSTYPSTYLSIYLHIYLRIYLPIHLPTYLST